MSNSQDRAPGHDLWRRAFAYAVDMLIASIPAYALMYFTIGVTPRTLLACYPSPLVGAWMYLRAAPEAEGLLLAALFVAAAFYVLYAPLSALLFGGQTAGKRIMKQVVMTDSGAASSGQILTREFLCKTLLNSIPPVAIVSIAFAAVRKDHRTLHDMITRTDVVDLLGEGK